MDHAPTKSSRLPCSGRLTKGARTNSGAPSTGHAHDMTPAAITRGHRVIVLCMVIAVLDVFDFVYTIFAAKSIDFCEENPVARAVLNSAWGPVLGLGTLKLSGLLLACTILIIYRRQRISELACWCMALVFAALMTVWLIYFSHVSL